jgi:N-acetylneuraminate synthase/N,N'-diacetyllegionaminate synthase
MSKSTIQIDNRTIGPGNPTFVIAEIGVNHDGSLQRALELVSIAAASGADAIKLQVFRSHTLMHETSAFAGYQKERCVENDAREMLKRYELSHDDVRRIVEASRQLNLIPLATPFSPDDVGVIDALDLPAVKIASPDIVNRPLLRRASRKGKPLIISTGAATMDEIAGTVQWLGDSRVNFALLHCISSYPTPTHEANLCWIGEMAACLGVPVGFSDHTTEPIAGAMSVIAGACVVEKHLTYDRTAQGPDHAASADPQQFSRYVSMIRDAEKLRGKPGKRVLEIEQDVRTVSRQSLVLLRDLKAGEVLLESDLTVQRPGTGIPAARLETTIGRRVVRALKAGAMLQWDMLSDAA